jgi:hypothetical protein
VKTKQGSHALLTGSIVSVHDRDGTRTC